MAEFTIIDELIEFSKELIELIKQDWEKCKKFFKEHKKYMFWIIVLFITMQFTDLMNLGTSWDAYCKKNKHYTMHTGGGNEEAEVAAPTTTQPVVKPTLSKQQAKKLRKETRKAKELKSAGEPGRISRVKSKFVASIKNNPVLGNLDKIYGMTGTAFSIIFLILIVIGVFSLPILILIVITYTVIKNLMSRFAIL